MTRVFCTYFDQFYLPRALALHQSLRRHAGDFHLYALCMDDASLEFFERHPVPHVTPVALTTLEAWEPRLLEAKKNRSRIEYYFTCSPSLCLYTLQRLGEADLITYLDADLFFFSSPEPLFDELKGSSIGIIEHRFSERSKRLARYGLYNVGWLSFRRDDNALACLHWWQDRCIEWCYDRPETERFADQKYLDEWPARFKGVHVIEHKGANVAGWNVANYAVRSRRGTVFIDELPLIFFHFAGFKQIRPWLYKTNFGSYPVYPSRVVRKEIFGPYIHDLTNVPVPGSPTQTKRAHAGHTSFLGNVKKFERLMRGIVFREYIFLFRGEVF